MAIGVGFFTVSTFVGGVVFGRRSKFPGMISGPDITPAVFMVEICAVVSNAICPDGIGGDDPSADDGSTSSSGGGGASGSHARALGGADGSTGYCEDEASVLPTCLAAMAIGTLLCGAGFGVLGKMRWSGVVGLVPADVIAGFHACIGYKVTKAAVEVAT